MAGPVLAAAEMPPATEARVRTAIVESIRARMGEQVEIDVSDVTINGRVTGTRLVATPEATARSGQASLFMLSEDQPRSQRRRVGTATARVVVSAPHVETTRGLSRGTVLAGDDLREAAGELIGVPLRHLPTLETLRGGRLIRDLGQGDVVTGQIVQEVPYVRSGDVVVVHVRIGPVIADGRAIASQNGGPGDVIRLVNPESRRTLRGRVVAPGEVEVVHES
jgi:flagella basal body P-ring formation protein FlgA